MADMLQTKEGSILLYQSEEGNVNIQVLFADETVWMSQKRMAELFGVESHTVTYHLQEIFKTRELDEEATTRKIRVVQQEGTRQIEREILFYSLDAIISVGYRVNSKQATQFRIWATKTLREFIIKGFALDDERLKNGQHFGKDYFDELLGRIVEIRASERRFYQKITDIYAQCSADYDENAEVTKTFYATVQNKLHWAITGSTAAETIAHRADAEKPHMGLTTWKAAPSGKIIKRDVSIAKNYLSENEISQLNRIVVMFLDYAQNQAERQKLMRMEDWIKRLDSFLQFNEYDVLENAGKVAAAVAKELAEAQYEIYRVKQDELYKSDFDELVDKMPLKNKNPEN